MEKVKKILIPIDIVLGVIAIGLIVLIVLMKVSGGKTEAAATATTGMPDPDAYTEEYYEGYKEFDGFSAYANYDAGYNNVSHENEYSYGDPMTDPDAYFFYDSDSRYLSDYDLDSLTAQELTYARNEIYARHGYVFNSDELNRFFSTKNWYYADPSWNPSSLNIYETENGNYINEYQDYYDMRYTPQ